MSTPNNNAAVAALQFALDADDVDPMAFLRCWQEGDFEAIRAEWPEAPEAVFIGADPLHPETKAQLEGAGPLDPTEILALWREAGGDTHGPNVETAVIPLDYLPQFVEAVRGPAAVPEHVQALQAIAAGNISWPIEGGTQVDKLTRTEMQQMASKALAAPAPVDPASAAVPEWRPIETAPKDHTILQLLVHKSDLPDCFDAEEPGTLSRSIGFNGLDDTGGDEWHLVGWNWQQDHFNNSLTVKPLGWLPMAPLPDAAPAPAEPAQQAQGERSDHKAVKMLENEVRKMNAGVGPSPETSDAIRAALEALTSRQEPIEQLEVDWEVCQTLADLPAVDEALCNFAADPTEDNAVCLVRAVLTTSPAYDEDSPTPAEPDPWLRVPRPAILWLFGLEGDFVPPEVLEGRNPVTVYRKRGNYWWRSVFAEKAGIDVNALARSVPNE